MKKAKEASGQRSVLHVGCAMRQAQFEPAEGGRGEAIYYDVVVDERNWGDVRVYSPGSDLETRETPVVEVELRIRNTSERPLALDLAETYAETSADNRFKVVEEEVRDGQGTQIAVAPRSTERVTLLYPLPPDVAPGEVRVFEFNWTVTTPAGPFSASSVFVPEREEQRVYYRPSPYWGPYFGYPHYLGYPSFGLYHRFRYD